MLVHSSTEIKNKLLITKVNFTNQAESFMSESYISQLHGNAHNKTRKWRYFNSKVIKR